MSADPLPPSAQERLFKADGDWYVKLRGHEVAGPYRSRPDAEAALAMRMRHWRRSGHAWPDSKLVGGIRSLWMHLGSSEHRRAS